MAELQSSSKPAPVSVFVFDDPEPPPAELPELPPPPPLLELWRLCFCRWCCWCGMGIKWLLLFWSWNSKCHFSRIWPLRRGVSVRNSDVIRENLLLPLNFKGVELLEANFKCS